MIYGKLNWDNGEYMQVVVCRCVYSEHLVAHGDVSSQCAQMKEGC